MSVNGTDESLCMALGFASDIKSGLCPHACALAQQVCGAQACHLQQAKKASENKEGASIPQNRCQPRLADLLLGC